MAGFNINDLLNGKSKGAAAQGSGQQDTAPATDANGFMNIPDGIDDELPFN